MSANITTSNPTIKKSARAEKGAVCSTHAEIMSHAPRATLNHSSQPRKSDSSTSSTKMIRPPTITEFRRAGVSSSNRRTQGDRHNQMPSTHIAQSDHCLGSEIFAGTAVTAFRAYYPRGGQAPINFRQSPCSHLPPSMTVARNKIRSCRVNGFGAAVDLLQHLILFLWCWSS